MNKSLRSLPEYQQLDRSIKRLSHLTVLNSVGDDYDLDLVREEVAYAQELLTKTIREGTEQYKRWTDHSKLRTYTVVTYYDYGDDNSFHYYCIEGDHSEKHRAQNHRVIVTDKKLPEVDHDSESLDDLCGEWMSRDMYNYVKLTLENYN